MGKTSTCKHDVLQLTPSPFAPLAGFEQTDMRARIAATTKSGRAPPDRNLPASNSKLTRQSQAESQNFPAPLILPHDALNYEPEGDMPAQSLKSWLNAAIRNKITPARKTLYVGAAPRIGKEVEFMRDWVKPNVKQAESARPVKRAKKEKNNGKNTADEVQLSPPTVDETISYLSSFYHGLPVKRLPTNLRWTAWEQGKSRTVPSIDEIPKYVALDYGKAATRVRARAAPDNMFAAQLNLDDILDAAIAMLPSDACAIVLLIDHDIYESPEDDFCAGRAYGGSRVSLVQTARYNPLLDEKIGIVRGHAWPMSHCKCVVKDICDAEGDIEINPPTAAEIRLSKSGAMRSAIDAVSDLKAGETKAEVESLWASRVLRTVSHELGYVSNHSFVVSLWILLIVINSHCLYLGHCQYYACIMQSTSSLQEDTRQPPSLCPVCLAKIAHAVSAELMGQESPQQQELWTRERYTSLREFCVRKRQSVGETILWVGLEAWLNSMLSGEEKSTHEQVEVIDLTGDE